MNIGGKLSMRKLRRERIICLIREGLSSTQIAERIRAKMNTVRDVAEAAGIKELLINNGRARRSAAGRKKCAQAGAPKIEPVAVRRGNQDPPVASPNVVACRAELAALRQAGIVYLNEARA